MENNLSEPLEGRPYILRGIGKEEKLTNFFFPSELSQKPLSTRKMFLNGCKPLKFNLLLGLPSLSRRLWDTTW